MGWSRAVCWWLAYVTCDACGRWQVVAPTDSGNVDDQCHCGAMIRQALHGWDRLWPATSHGYQFDERDGPQNTIGT